MVNISKRMRVLKRKLLSVRRGPGAAILPQYLPQPNNTSSPAHPLQATLLRLRLDFPPGIGPASKGARAFWRNHLRRLKYHNPALPITVNQSAQKGTPGNPGPAWRLFLDFEGEEKALRELASEPENGDFRRIMEEELKPRPRNTIQPDPVADKSQSQLGSGQSAPRAMPSSNGPHAEPSPQTSPEHNLISHRTVSLPVLNRPAGALWFWFQQRTKCVPVPESEADTQLESELAEHSVKAEEDRKRLKRSLDEIRAKRDMLKLARREADIMKAEQQ